MLVISTHPSDHRHTNALKAALADIEAPGWAVVFGDRRDMLEAALDLHYQGIKLVHVGGGDTPHGTDSHPDHRTRDAISMLARVHCVANEYAAYNLDAIGVGHNSGCVVAITGSPGLDEVVAYAANKPERGHESLVLVHPHPSDTDATDKYVQQARHVCNARRAPSRWLCPNTDDGGRLRNRLLSARMVRGYRLPLQSFLAKLAHCGVFITNSSAGMYEAEILGTPVHWIGDRQAGRKGPYHHPEGRACEAIRKVVEDVCIHRS